MVLERQWSRSGPFCRYKSNPVLEVLALLHSKSDTGGSSVDPGIMKSPGVVMPRKLAHCEELADLEITRPK